MKKLIILVITIGLICVFVHCSSNGSATAAAAGTATAVKDTASVHAMDRAAFLEKVFNYTTDSVWAYRGSKPAIIDFSATWCQPCKTIAPILDELAVEYKDKLVIYKIDVDEEEELAAVFGISSVPSILFVPMEGKPSMVKGAAPKEFFVQAISDLLLKE